MMMVMMMIMMMRMMMMKMMMMMPMMMKAEITNYIHKDSYTIMQEKKHIQSINECT